MRKILMIVDASNKEDFDRLVIHRMPGALPFAGKYRLIDFPLSLAKHANITNVAIFPYGNYRSLGDHVGSGKRWDLDRRKDGLFILPPKHFHLPTENMLTFQRMFEHIEFFRRSSQDYVFLTQANIVWNLDIQTYVEQHHDSGADISEIMHENLRLKTFILKRETLLDLLEIYDQLPTQTMNEYVAKTASHTVKILNYPHYTRYITDNFNYLKANLAMLDFENGRQVFDLERPILSKEKPAPPARYLTDALVDNAMIASGCVINGTVKHSIIGRDVTIAKGAVVKNSILMNNTVIESGVVVHHAILDKGTVVKQNTFIEGTLSDPFVSQKEQVITLQTHLSVLFVAAESTPFVKTGGLGDVINDLSRNLVKSGVSVTVMMPYYGFLKEKIAEVAQRFASHSFVFDEVMHKINLYQTDHKGVRYVFVESFYYFDEGPIYQDSDCDRFAFFNQAVVETVSSLDEFSVIHCHDWHTGLIPLLLKKAHNPTPTLFTVHNVDYQGECLGGVCQRLVEPNASHENVVNFLELGLTHATKIATVSPTYREELKYEYYGKNLASLFIQRERDFHGILNGISSRHDPHTDKLIHANYDRHSFAKKALNKRYLQKLCDLSVDADAFVMGMVGRLTEQKGFSIILAMLERFLSTHDKAQFVLLGTGDETIKARLQTLESKFPKRMKLFLTFDGTLPNYIYAGADVFVMPSRVEPCGLAQLIAMRYGTVPIVRQTGGLNDTVINYDPISRRGTGFSFFNYDAPSLAATCDEAYTLFTEDKPTFEALALRAMKEDFGLLKQANRMIDLYYLTRSEV